ncbi:MAG: HEPN domain-containing protein [Rhodocyclales bacterium]|nr:HEPN domain-containing protein [Rhodocyclales bacterium]
MAEATVALMLLTAARQDAKAFSALAGLADIGDAIVGFHAQQAVEKALKSVLSAHRVEFRRTHDIAELLDLLFDHQLAAPPDADRLDELNPYAVDARYGLLELSSELDRQALAAILVRVLDWAAGSNDQPSSTAS